MSSDDSKDLGAVHTSGMSDDRKPEPLEQTIIAAEDDLPSDAQAKDFEGPTHKSNTIVHIPTPNRRRTTPSIAASVVDSSSDFSIGLTEPQSQQSHCGPTPWEGPRAVKSSQQEGGSYRDQLRVSGQQALQRARENGLVPKASGSSSGASSPSSSAAPLPLSIFGALNTQQPTAGPPSGTVQPQQQVQYQLQPAFFQPQAYFQPQQTCFQPQQAFFVAQVPPMMGYQTSGAMMPPQVQPQLPCHDQRQVTHLAPSPTTGFELNNEQLAEMLKHASEDVYED
jgi:hypothetical protein